jgi:hypothetical protein
MLRESKALMREKTPALIRLDSTAADKQPSWSMLRNSIVDLMTTEIELGLTFAQVAKTSRNAETKARNLQNARKAYATVARFLATKDGTQSLIAGIADRLSILSVRLADLGEEAETRAKAATRAGVDSTPKAVGPDMRCR